MDTSDAHMRSSSSLSRRVRTRRDLRSLALGLGLVFGWSAPAWAIPSPDLVISLSASFAQVLGLLSVVFGGLAFSSRTTLTGEAKTQTPARRWSFKIVLGLFIAALGVNIYQYTREADANNQRLRTNLTRASVEQGEKVGDVSLKTLSYSEQLTHPLGIETDEVAAWMAEGRSINLIDIREPEERESGYLEGTSHIRYPDLQRDPSKLFKAGQETVLLCYSGNRSSELCEYFGQEGQACRFMVGGHEKWIAEGRSLVLDGKKVSEDLRALPDYPNKAVLLDTPEVTDLVANDGAVFVDVRYPGEFEQGHLPGAHNITVRKLPSDELTQALEGLPRKPVIAPCYDKRSCFYAEILGLRLSRLGYDYRGRYTVPHEYTPPRTDKAHVAAWKARNEGATLFSLVSRPLRATLNYFTEWTGQYATGILLLVLLLRLVFLPISLKADRDQMVQRALAPELKELKRKLAGDTQRISKATIRRYREEGLTPVRNLIGTSTQLVLFLVFFSVVNRVANEVDQGILWVSEARLPDPLYVLPGLVSAIFVVFIVTSFAQRTPGKLALAGLGGILMAMLTVRLNAAVNLYLVLNISLILLQTTAFRALMKRRKRDAAGRRPRKEDPGIVPLRDAAHYPATGQKAIRLSQMLAAGFPVPDGFVVTSKLLCRNGNGTELTLSATEGKALDRMWRKSKASTVAVRSSGLNEDSSTSSYAGVFDSILKVEREGLVDALNQVRSSLSSKRTEIYAGNEDEQGGALVQNMVEAQFAGVLFTEHPDSTGSALVELVVGLGDNLVSGKVTPGSYRFGRVSGRLLDDAKPAIDLAPLIALGRKVEELFGRPQDIEWAFASGKFFLLQARDITASTHDDQTPEGAAERERRKLIDLARGADPDEMIFVQNELSELLPKPTPFSASLMERLWAVGGSADLACRTLGIPYDVDDDSQPYVTTIFGSLYVNRREERRRIGKGTGAMAAFRLARGAEDIEAQFRDSFLPAFLKRARLHEALDFERLSTEQLLSLYDTWTEEFITQTYRQAEVINVATDFYWKTASRKLQRKGIDPALYLGKMPETVVHRAMSLLGNHQKGPEYIKQFLELFGHRAPYDYELSQPRYRESSELVIQQLSTAKHFVSAASFDEVLPTDPVLRLAVARAQRFQVLKEDAKHHCLRQLNNLRQLLLALDRRLGLNGGIFQLSFSEIPELARAGFVEHAGYVIKQRRQELKAWESIRLPSELSATDLEKMETQTGSVKRAGGEQLQGTRVAGRGDVVGIVHVIHDPSDVKSFKKGEILVARLTDPTWFPLFPLTGGIVTEVGGWLSHAAIVARELGITAIVGVRGASDALHTGQLVRLNPDGTIEKLEDKRSSTSPLRAHRDQEPPPAIELDAAAVG